MRVRVVGIIVACVLAIGGPCEALPKFAREYGVTCQTCHSIPPRLNTFGLAFQANYYNWPAGKEPARKLGSNAFPVSGLASFSAEDNRTADKTTANFRELELFFAGGFRPGKERRGGYLVDLMAGTTEEEAHTGDLDQAFVAVPVAGKRGQGSLIVGQFSPLRPQWHGESQLIESAPLALEDELDGFSFAEAGVGLRATYFDHQGRGTADGSYLTLGVPFEGQLALNRHAKVGSRHGVYAHGFRRRGLASLGGFGYTHAGNHLEGLIGTYELRKNLSLLGIGALGHDAEGSTRRLSLQGDYVVSPRLALTARLDSLGGRRNDLGSGAAVTYYPFKLPALRLTAELTERKGDHSFILFARGQF